MSEYYWKDFDNEMMKANDGDVVTMPNVQAVFNSLTNIINTIQGSRRMLPEFALPLHRLLFEPIDTITASRIADLLYGAIIRWEPRIEIEGLEVTAYPDANLYDVILMFRIVGSATSQDVLTINQILRAV